MIASPGNHAVAMQWASRPSSDGVGLTSVVPFATENADRAEAPRKISFGDALRNELCPPATKVAVLPEQEFAAGLEAQRDAVRQISSFLDRTAETYAELLRQNSELRGQLGALAVRADPAQCASCPDSALCFAHGGAAEPAPTSGAAHFTSLAPAPAAASAALASDSRQQHAAIPSVGLGASGGAIKRTSLQTFLQNRTNDRREITNQQTRAWGDLSHIHTTSGSRRQQFCAKVANGGLFEFLQVVLIVSHACLGGWRTSQEAQRQIEAARSGGTVLDAWDAFDFSDVFFMVAFSAELFIRVFAEEREFVTGAEKYSNLFDVVMWVSLFGDAAVNIQDGNVFQFLRPLRVFRVLRLAKIRDNIPATVRRKQWMLWFNNLFDLLDAAIRALFALVPVISVLILTFYMIALCIVSGVDSFASEINANSTDADRQAFEVMSERYSSIPVAMFTLLQAYLGLMYTSEYYHPVLHMHPLNAATFLILWIALRWVIQNVVVGEVCNVIRSARSPGAKQALAMEARKAQEHIELLMGLFAEKEASFGATLTQKELGEVLKDAHLVYMLGLPRWQAMELHRYLDPEDRGLRVRVLIEGAVQLRKPPRGMDVWLLQEDVCRIQESLTALTASALCTAGGIH